MYIKTEKSVNQYSIKWKNIDKYFSKPTKNIKIKLIPEDEREEGGEFVSNPFDIKWIYRELDAGPIYSNYSNAGIKRDSYGNIHIVYFFGDEIKYVLIDNNENTQLKETVGYITQSESAGLSLIVDNDNYPHISYITGVNRNELFYASKTNGSWLNEHLKTFPTPCVGNSITLNSVGNPIIAVGESKLWLINRATDGNWHESIIKSQNSYWPSIVQENDNLHIMHYSNGWYLTSNIGFGWVTQVIDLNPGPFYANLAIWNSSFHTVYVDNSIGKIKYAHNLYGDWQIEEIGDAYIFPYSDLYINCQENELIVFYKRSPFGSNVAVKNILSQNWVIHEMNNMPFSDYGQGILKDNEGYLHIISSNGELAWYAVGELID
jgi:hypothetical protein